MPGPVIYSQPMVDDRKMITRPWLLYFNGLFGTGSLGGPIIVGPAPPSSLPGSFVLTDSTTIHWDFSVPGVVTGHVIMDGAGYWTLLTLGDPLNPELIFDGNGDVISMFVPT